MRLASILWGLTASGLLGGSLAAPAQGHGAISAVEKTISVRVTSQYDTGEPIAQGQVAVYSPNNLESPWMTGTTDEAGVFEFTPADIAGDWEVVIRKAGHGQSITVPMTAADINPGRNSGLLGGTSAIQKLLTAAAIVWGFVGTALFFARRSSAPTAPVAPSVPHESVTQEKEA
ncbi:MAG: carboxypeptidase regulatory-like domain-containing protein [Cyanobacteria bacterium J06628_6]